MGLSFVNNDPKCQRENEVSEPRSIFHSHCRGLEVGVEKASGEWCFAFVEFVFAVAAQQVCFWPILDCKIGVAGASEPACRTVVFDPFENKGGDDVAVFEWFFLVAQGAFSKHFVFLS